MKEREKFGTRLGFILVSAGCAVGLGNVWKFPYMCGKNGGALFIIIYLIFLALLGFPIMVCEFAVGRASKKSCASSFRALEPKGTKWHRVSLIGMSGNYLLMMFYTVVAGWMLYYCYRCAAGEFTTRVHSVDEINEKFGSMMGNPGTMFLWTIITVIVSFGICALGMKNGVEKITKIMMISLLALIVVLAIHSLTLPGAMEGVKFYLVPDVDKVLDIGLGNVIFDAMSQAFFTLSIGIGSMAIFGSYLDKERSLTGETATITILDTLVALMAGLIIIPACFAYGINPDSGPKLIFVTLPNIFTQMAGGRIWGTLFFLFMSFAALSTVTAVFENIISFAIDLWGWERKKAVAVNLVAIILLSLPCVLGFNVLSGIQPLGPGSGIMDLEDFLVSNNFLPIGAMIYLMFCTSKRGWGFENFTAEANAGRGTPFPKMLRGYMTYVLPMIIVVIYLKGYWDIFASKGPGYLIPWMAIAVAFLAFAFRVALGRKKTE